MCDFEVLTGAAKVTALISHMPPPLRCDTKASFSALYSGVIFSSDGSEDSDNELRQASSKRGCAGLKVKIEAFAFFSRMRRPNSGP